MIRSRRLFEISSAGEKSPAMRTQLKPTPRLGVLGAAEHPRRHRVSPGGPATIGRSGAGDARLLQLRVTHRAAANRIRDCPS